MTQVIEYDINDQFTEIKRLLATRKHLVLEGSAGIGKSWVVKQHFLEQGQAIIDVNGGKITPISLYIALWHATRKQYPLILDDVEGILNDKTAVALLKGAMETSDKRVVSWGSNTRILSTKNIPQGFEFDSKIFILTNMVVAEATGQLGEHLRAITSRTRPFDLHLEPHEVFARVKHVCLTEGMIEFYLRGAYKTPQMVDSVWRYFEANHHALKQPDLRTIYKIIEEVNDGADWQRSIAMSEMKKGCQAVRV